MVEPRPIEGHKTGSTSTRVECSLYLPTELFHTLHDEWLALSPHHPSFSKFLVSQIEKGRRNDDL